MFCFVCVCLRLKLCKALSGHLSGCCGVSSNLCYPPILQLCLLCQPLCPKAIPHLLNCATCCYKVIDPVSVDGIFKVWGFIEARVVIETGWHASVATEVICSNAGKAGKIMFWRENPCCDKLIQRSKERAVESLMQSMQQQRVDGCRQKSNTSDSDAHLLLKHRQPAST